MMENHGAGDCPGVENQPITDNRSPAADGRKVLTYPDVRRRFREMKTWWWIMVAGKCVWAQVSEWPNSPRGVTS